MPQTARLTRNRSKSMTPGRIPGGMSEASKELSLSAINSIREFYGASEVLPYYSLQFPLDTISVVESIVGEILKETLAKLQNLLTWSAGWNGYDALAPDPDAVVHARNWIVRLFLEAADLGRVWIKPNVIADADGEVVFEWWNGPKKLTVYK